MNNGLATNFKLESGKFALTKGSDKADDNILMFLAFFGFFRVFTEDFCISIYLAYERSIDNFNKYKTFFKLLIQDVGAKYLDFVNIYNITITRGQKDRKNSIDIDFEYNLPNVKTQNTITFTNK